MDGAQDATVGSSIGAPEVVSHVVKYDYFETGEILSSCWLIQSSASKVSITIIVVVK